MSLISLRDALVSRDRYMLYKVGLLMIQLEGSGVVVQRRTEEISFPEQNINHRSIAIECDPRQARRFAEALGFALDTIPLLRIPKGVYFNLGLECDGDAIPLLGRDQDAAAAYAHLMACAVERGLGPPPPSAASSLQASCRKFPPTYDAYATPTWQGRALERSRVLPDESLARDWYEQASQVRAWTSLLTKYEEGFVVMPSSVPEADSWTFRLSYTEAKQWHGPKSLVERMKSSPLPSKSLSLRLNEVGRARSEHFRIDAPEGTFLTTPTLMQLGEPDLHYRVRQSRRRHVIYVQNVGGAAPRSATVAALLWPSPRGLVVPVRVLGIVAVVISFTVLATGGAYDAKLATMWPLAIFLPSAALLWVNQPTRAPSPIRDRLIRNWLRYALVACFLPVVMFAHVGFVADLPFGWSWGDALLRWVFFVASLGSCSVLIMLSSKTKRVDRDQKDLEPSTPAKGVRLEAIQFPLALEMTGDGK